MSLRAVWIITQSGDSPILLFRKFATVEKRAKQLQCDNYVQIPNEEILVHKVILALGLNKKDFKFVDWRDRIDKKGQVPVLDVETGHGILWPVIVINHGSLFLCCLPLVQNMGNEDDRPDLITLPEVTIGFTVLEGIASLIGNSGVTKLNDVDTFLRISMPFGTPYDTDPHNVLALTSGDFKKLTRSQSQLKSKPNMTIGVKESVRCFQWDQTHTSNISEVFGSILVKAELENSQTDVTLTLNHIERGQKIDLQNMLYHSCVHNTNWTNPDSSLEWKKFKFTPPTHRFTLCNYVTPNTDPPIVGIFELKGQQEVELSLSLTLSKGIKNNFNYCEARFPFVDRGSIRKVDCKPSWGHVHLTDDKKTLVWNIGQKFPPKTHCAKLSATVKFASKQNETALNNNTYVQLQFLIQDFCLSGCVIDLSSIQFSPPSKIKIQAERELKSADYKIWNRNGDVPVYTHE